MLYLANENYHYKLKFAAHNNFEEILCTDVSLKSVKATAKELFFINM